MRKLLIMQLNIIMINVIDIMINVNDINHYSMKIINRNSSVYFYVKQSFNKNF